ncbi:hypothetical protein [Dactylosporangium sp. NPDC051541]|uniref:hypothetical protein n=1 Tax=Dactylosporangium sp. NPDC051541 TaxID=3363977 RepID=UPI0037973631
MFPDDDDALMEELRRAAAVADPVPDLVLINARAAFATRDLDAQLAALVADSLAAAGEPAAVRGPGEGESLLLFAAGPAEIDLAVVERPGGLTLIGQLTGAEPTGCELERGDGHREPVEVDELGRFLISGVPPGPLRLHCRVAPDNLVVTPWTNV